MKLVNIFPAPVAIEAADFLQNYAGVALKRVSLYLKTMAERAMNAAAAQILRFGFPANWLLCLFTAESWRGTGAVLLPDLAFDGSGPAQRRPVTRVSVDSRKTQNMAQGISQ